MLVSPSAVKLNSTEKILISQEYQVSTLCCRVISASLTTQYFLKSKALSPSGLNVLKISWNFPAVPDVVIEFKCSYFPSAGPATPQAIFPFAPSTLILNSSIPRSNSATFSSLRSSLLPGTYLLDFTLRSLLPTSLPFGNDILSIETANFTVIDGSVNPDPVVSYSPRLSSCRLSDDGSFLKISFDISTNYGGFGTNFRCSSLFLIDSKPLNALCVWQSSLELFFYAPSNRPLQVDGIITLLEGKLRASCLSPKSKSTSCSNYPSSPEESIFIQPPLNPVVPDVVIFSPSVIRACEDLMIDLTASRGNCGRTWSNWTLEVSSTVNVSSIHSFLKSNYSVSSPIAIPKSLLVSNHTYVFVITLCNYCGRCNEPFTHVVGVVADEEIAVAMIHSQSDRSMHSSDLLRLSATGYVQKCGMIRPTTTGVIFNWEIFLVDAASENLVPVPIHSESRNPTTFALKSDTLLSDSLYIVRFSVVLQSTGSSSESSIRIIVEPPKVFARLQSSSGTTADQSLRVGDALTLDSSQSFDEFDLGNPSGLIFEWSCATVNPIEREGCMVDIIPLTSTSSQVSVTPSLNPSAVNSTVLITLTIYDSGRLRSDSLSMSVTILESISPRVVTSCLSPSVQENAKLRIIGQVTLASAPPIDKEMVVEWSVNDNSLNLSDISLTPVTKTVQGVWNNQNFVMNLVLKPNSLPPYASYVFTLRCQESFSSVSVVVSGPPRLGSFTISPESGNEDSDLFTLKSWDWIDDEANLPLSYRFGFLTTSGLSFFLGPASEKNSLDVFLPRGDPLLDNRLLCFVQVSNLLSASSNITRTARVFPVGKTYESLALDVSTRLSSLGSIEGLEESISSFTIQMTAVNCSLSPNCTALGRNLCSAIPHTCGECLSGYLGELGHLNDPCYSKARLSDRSLQNCRRNEDCGLFAKCDEFTFTCAPDLRKKSCPSDCSGHGVCHYRSKSTYLLIDECKVGDLTCIPVCTCLSGYSSSDCSLTDANMTWKRNTRLQLVDSLTNILQRDDPTPTVLEYVVSLLSHMLSSSAELSPEICFKGMETLDDILGLVERNVDVLSNIYEPINSCFEYFGSVSVSELDSEEKNIGISNVFTVWKKYNSFVASEMLLGEESIETVSATFSSRLLVEDSYPPHFLMGVPISNLETVLANPSSSIQFPSTLPSATTVELYSFLSRLASSNFTNFLSDPVQVMLSRDANLSMALDISESHEVLFRLVHFHPVSFSETDTIIENKTTHCRRGEKHFHNLSCSSGDIFTHTCNGAETFDLVTLCPTTSYLPECLATAGGEAILSDQVNSSQCRLVNYSATSLYCLCNISLSFNDLSGSRRLSLARRSGAHTVVALGKYQKSQLQTTAYSVTDISARDLTHSVEVLVMFALMWFVIPVVVFALSYLNESSKSTSQNRRHSTAPIPEQIPRRRSRTRRSSVEVSGATAYSYLLKYIDSVIPVIFQPRQSLWSYVSHEILEHHRYLNIFLLRSKQSEKMRFITAFQMLTVQSMLIFLLSIFFDLQYPAHANAGTCGHYLTEEGCLSETSIFESDESICRWVSITSSNSTLQSSPSLTESGYCRESTVKVSLKVMVIMVLFISATAAPINYLIDSLVDILAAPSSDDHVEMVEASTQQRLKHNLNRSASQLFGRGISVLKRGVSGVVTPLRRLSQIENFKRMWLLEEEAIKLPDSVVNSHCLARTALKTLTKKKLQLETEDYVNPFGETVLIDHLGTLLSAASSPAAADSPNQQSVGSLSVFFTQILSQYEKLSGPSKKFFAESWGISPTFGGFIQPNYGEESCCHYGANDMERLLADEIKSVARLSASRIHKLQHASDLHCGLVILHLFIADLLGV
jgi:hypothetical protein